MKTFLTDPKSKGAEPIMRQAVNLYNFERSPSRKGKKSPQRSNNFSLGHLVQNWTVFLGLKE